MKCIICNCEIELGILKRHFATQHKRSIQLDHELRHYLFSLKSPINRKYFVCLQCNTPFTNNRDYYLHKVMHNISERRGQVGGGGGDDDDVHVVQQNHINAWKVMTYMVTPKAGRKDWWVFIDNATEAYKRKVGSFVRAENARHVTMQVKIDIYTLEIIREVVLSHDSLTYIF